MMPPQSKLPRVLRIGTFEVDVPAGELRKNGVKLKLQEQPFQVLCMLLEHPGEVVTREELRNRLWPADTFVDFDHGVNAAIKRLRDALGDSAENPHFVETLARRGYRFIASVDTQAMQPVAQPRAFRLTRTFEAIRPAYLLGLAGTAAVILALVATLNGVGGYRWRPGPSGKRIESLAVLPLENLSHDPDQEYFSDGMTDALIADLSKIGALRVTSRTSSTRYKKTSKSLPEIARELNVDGVVEGSVMRSGNRVRITARLIHAPTEQNLWSETYERDLGDVLKLQGDVAEAVAQQVRAQLTTEQQARLRSAPAVNPSAYEAYLKGRFSEVSSTQVGLKQAQDHFTAAIREDPRFALAYVGLADCYLELGTSRWLPPQDAYRQGSEAIHRALQLDETLGEAHTTLGYLNWRYSWDWQTAEREFRRGVTVNAKFIDGHEALVWFLAWAGRREEALAQVEEIRRLDPTDPHLFIDESGIYYHQRDYKSLVEVSQKSVAVNPELWSSHYFLAVGYEGSGQPAQAIPEYQRAVELSQRDSDTTAGLAHAYATMGRRAEAEKILSELQRQSKITYVSPYMIAVIYVGLGQNDKAFEFLEKAYQERSPDLPYFIKVDLRIDGLRPDPRFQDLLRRVGLPHWPT
jgi:TolB-like protein/DNA-binding winged helix-turn-helix (wHTH) protein/Tfp pilus assembly protein PilF